ncbi:DUF4352 domain-containing protein [Anaerotignum sp. MB30-C6]|uniref:DUF4352 domain-containing protein n=1 Tax=Anaerotignum sp. MB30-C6 TaxID=3070814 RepID=UPI0027DCC738|nr:DUF4352 domain-containing protein [Anaerotignum sp. MB30-C6]WMI80916.1 DUF4352 domain-containing protein [Anaerotignum sp. MB30-C6]
MMKKCAMLGIVFMLSFGMIGCGGETDTTASQEETAKVERGESTEVEQGVSVALNGVTTTEEDHWDELEEGKELLVLDVSITNHFTDDYEFNPYYFTLQANGKSMLVSDERPKDTETLNSYKVAPEETLNGIICFDVDKGTTEYRIFYTDADDMDIELTLD